MSWFEYLEDSIPLTVQGYFEMELKKRVTVSCYLMFKVQYSDFDPRLSILPILMNSDIGDYLRNLEETITHSHKVTIFSLDLRVEYCNFCYNLLCDVGCCAIYCESCNQRLHVACASISECISKPGAKQRSSY